MLQNSTVEAPMHLLSYRIALCLGTVMSADPYITPSDLYHPCEYFCPYDPESTSYSVMQGLMTG